ncbi:UDP-N-acetylglucosamine 2-epimerase (non-hydrolyzing) [bacterium]|nr:UDP-N-acetylglucosamine 2-epimerase (non-hydrolyzing) [bacterium]
MHIVSIVGARPNFVKIAPIARACCGMEGVRHTLIHTGQHYDRAMSDSFFDVLGIPEPDVNLNVGSGSHGVQTGKVMIAIEPVLQELQPDWVVTVGDVNSTAAAALVAVKLGLKTVHVEAGLRSFDRTMPEEINRLVTDAISDELFVTEQAALDNLKNEGVADEIVHFTGNVMIDSLVHALPKVEAAQAWKSFGLEKGSYVLVTLHRPSNVDQRESLEGLVHALSDISKRTPVLFPAHPRTKARLEEFGLLAMFTESGRVHLTAPQDYQSFLSLVTGARAMLTDSGGIQEETTYLGIPCITLRPNTERPSTINLGTNELVTPEYKPVMEAFGRIASGSWKEGTVPPLWDGKAAERIVRILGELDGQGR